MTNTISTSSTKGLEDAVLPAAAVGGPVEGTPGVDLEAEGERVNATMRLAFSKIKSPELHKASAKARLDYVAALIAMDEAEYLPGRHNLNEQAAVEAALRVYGQSIADLIRGEASS
jgi:hypothetical protein